MRLCETEKAGQHPVLRNATNQHSVPCQAETKNGQRSVLSQAEKRTKNKKWQAFHPLSSRKGKKKMASIPSRVKQEKGRQNGQHSVPC